jgi:uncharacterized membrane protein
VDANDRIQEYKAAKRMGPFRRAVLRGLGVLLPPLLTIVIFLWVAHTVGVYMLEPLETTTRSVAVEYFTDIRTPNDADSHPNADTVVIEGDEYQVTSKGTVTIDEQVYHRTPEDGKFVPLHVYESVRQGVGRDPMPTSAKDVYIWYINHKWLPRRLMVPILLCLLLLVLYLLGKFLAAGMGRFFWNQMERIIQRVPLVRNVYSSIKQVTDFIFTDTEVQFTRVVALEYPRRGIWTMAFVTGEGMTDIRAAAQEPVLSAFVPHSPMPFTGFAVTVKKSETVDLNISVDQAIQFVVSCGVVIPPPIIGFPENKAIEGPALGDGPISRGG